MTWIVFKATRNWLACIALLAGLVAASGTLRAAVIVDTSTGYASPTAQLGGYTMTPFGRNLGTIPSSTVNSATDLGLTVQFSGPVEQTTIGAGGWAGWSHGYTGTVWHTAVSATKTSITLTLPTGTKAFYFYAMPGAAAGSYNVSLDTVEAAQGGTVTKLVDVLSGAHFFGAYTTAGSSLTQLTITVPGAAVDGFAFGEFGIFNDGTSGGAIPEPTSMAIFGLAGLACVARRVTAKRRG